MVTPWLFPKKVLESLPRLFLFHNKFLQPFSLHKSPDEASSSMGRRLVEFDEGLSRSSFAVRDFPAPPHSPNALLTRGRSSSRKDISDASKRKEKQKWAFEKPKLDDDEEFKDIMKNAQGKLEIPVPAAMPCKT